MRGSFLFVIEGPPGWAALGMQALRAALEQDGIGGKAAGYGFFLEEEDKNCIRTCRQRAKNAEKERLRRKQERAAREKAVRRASLSEEEQLIDTLKTLCEGVGGKPTSRQVQKIDRAIKELLEKGIRWQNSDYRARAASQISMAYDLIGWHETGVKKAKRGKQRTIFSASVMAIQMAMQQPEHQGTLLASLLENMEDGVSR